MSERIAIVTETFPPEINGVAMTLGRLVRGLRARGHAVTVARPRRAREADAYDPGELMVAGAALPRYPDLRFGFPATRQLRRRWAIQRPDVVYVATQGPLGWSAARAARRIGIPVVSGFHTRFDAYASHYRLGLVTPLVAAYLRCFHNGTDGTLVPTPELRDGLVDSGFRNVRVLGRGVDAELFHPARRAAHVRRGWGAGEGDLVVLYVGRIAAEKNIALAVEAFRAMQRVRDGVRFVLVGDGPLRSTLAAAHPDLIFAGTQRDERLAEHYASGDVFLFPSETETYGNVVPEALASGLAVVAYDAAAARMLIAPGDSGVLAPLANARAFVAAAAALARTPDVLPAMRRRARAAVAPHDWPRVVERFAGLLIAAAERRRATDVAPLVTGRTTSHD